MKNKLLLLLALFLLSETACSGLKKGAGNAGSSQTPFIWENANVYFLMTDRFYNGDPNNDVNFSRNANVKDLRRFMGGDIPGIIQKIEAGYFDELGITAIWFTPVVEQIHGKVDEGMGETYGYHGYWAKDWTALDPNFGTEAELARLVETAHAHGIRILMDVVVNHTGPVTEKDPVWPETWVRTSPQCTYLGMESTVSCTLVKNLPDIRTDRDEPVGLPAFLKEKWEREGRLQQELDELDAFFERTGYPRSPRYYIIKWLTDYIRKYGIDGFRLDTVKHTEADVWEELKREAEIAFHEWKSRNPGKVLDATPFYTIGEVYGYAISNGRIYNYGDEKVDFFAHGNDCLINFEFKGDAHLPYEALFSKYSSLLNFRLQGNSVLNYISSHDDAGPFDKLRESPIVSATKLLLCPGASQVYYGDETSRLLEVPGATGDTNLRSFMNWDELESDVDRNGHSIREILDHWQKLGRFRKDHPAVGAGIHEKLSDKPYLFRRVFNKGGYNDTVVVGLDLEPGVKEIAVGKFMEDGIRLKDYYSGQEVVVKNGRVRVDSGFDIVLLGIAP